jgi:hypothetical protein
MACSTLLKNNPLNIPIAPHIGAFLRASTDVADLVTKNSNVPRHIEKEVGAAQNERVN